MRLIKLGFAFGSLTVLCALQASAQEARDTTPKPAVHARGFTNVTVTARPAAVSPPRTVQTLPPIRLEPMPAAARTNAPAAVRQAATTTTRPTRSTPPTRPVKSDTVTRRRK